MIWLKHGTVHCLNYLDFFISSFNYNCNNTNDLWIKFTVKKSFRPCPNFKRKSTIQRNYGSDIRLSSHAFMKVNKKQRLTPNILKTSPHFIKKVKFVILAATKHCAHLWMRARLCTYTHTEYFHLPLSTLQSGLITFSSAISTGSSKRNLKLFYLLYLKYYSEWHF